MKLQISKKLKSKSDELKIDILKLFVNNYPGADKNTVVELVDAPIEVAFYKDKVIKFVLGKHRGQGSGRNTFINQQLAPVLKKTPIDKIVYIFRDSYRDEDEVSRESTVFTSLRILKTLGIPMYNIGGFADDSKINAYSNVNEFLDESFEISQKKTNKNPILLVEKNNIIYIHGEFGGATETDLVVKLFTLFELTEKNIVLTGKISEKSAENLAKIFINNQFFVSSGKVLKGRFFEPIMKQEIRNQSLFINKLLENYKTTSCLFCDVNVSALKIASHIDRVADIKSKDISYYEKVEEASSGYNGFFSCRNHDVLFERGIIYINENFEVNMKHGINTETHEYCKASIKNWELKDKLNSESLPFIKKHLERINIK